MVSQESPNYFKFCLSVVRLHTGKRNRNLFLCSLETVILKDPNLLKFWILKTVLQVASCGFHQQTLRSFPCWCAFCKLHTFFNEERPLFYITQNHRRSFLRKTSRSSKTTRHLNLYSYGIDFQKIDLQHSFVVTFWWSTEKRLK